MIQITNVYRQHLPPVRLIGKPYGNSDRDTNGGFGDKWRASFAEDLPALDRLGTFPENENAYLGCMSMIDGQFTYWIGKFFNAGTEVPEGFQYVDLPAGDIGACWIYGRDDNGEIYGIGPHNACEAKLREAGWKARSDFGRGSRQEYWFFERFAHPRFTEKDEHGKVTLDYCFYLEAL